MGFVTAFYYSILLLTVSNPTCASSKECDFPAILNFGDSISDTGGLSVAFTPPPWPYGISYFHMSTGRESDGRLLIDFIGMVSSQFFFIDTLKLFPLTCVQLSMVDYEEKLANSILFSRLELSL